MGPTELAFADQPLADSGDRPAAGKEMEEMEEEEHLDEEINEWLVEADVYLKYGIVDKAMDHLKRIIQIAPRNIGAHERLKMIYMDKGHREAAILQCLTLADIFEKRGDKKNAIGEIEAILSLSPGHSIGKKKLEELVSQLPASLTEEALLSSLEPIQFVDEEIEFPVEATTPLETAFPSGEPGNLRVEDRRSRVESIEEEELPEGFESLLDEEEGTGEARRPISVGQESESMARLMTGLEEDLAEADFYLQHGMQEEARSVYRKILKADPSNRSVQDRLSELEPPLAPPGEPGRDESVAPSAVEQGKGMGEIEERILGDEISLAVTSRPEDVLTKEVTPVFKVAPPVDSLAKDSFVDFAAELEKELERDQSQQRAIEELARSEIAPPTLGEILQEFQKGVRQSLEEKDFDTHYNLGIAYMDMDLIEEAIEEFELASKDPALAVNCSQLIGLCYMKMGADNLAIEEYLKGLSVPNQPPEKYRGLKYELALAYESSGTLDTAFDLFSEIFQEDPNYRDVAAKVKSFSAGQPQKAETPQEPPEAEAKMEPLLQPEKGEPQQEEKPPEGLPAPRKPRTRKVDYV